VFDGEAFSWYAFRIGCWYSQSCRSPRHTQGLNEPLGPYAGGFVRDTCDTVPAWQREYKRYVSGPAV
jgi:hypothetical protein